MKCPRLAPCGRQRTSELSPQCGSLATSPVLNSPKSDRSRGARGATPQSVAKPHAELVSSTTIKGWNLGLNLPAIQRDCCWLRGSATTFTELFSFIKAKYILVHEAGTAPGVTSVMPRISDSARTLYEVGEVARCRRPDLHIEPHAAKKLIRTCRQARTFASSNDLLAARWRPQQSGFRRRIEKAPTMT